ncbi:Transmembrane protein 104 [Acanthosepion pharaonis]|uniref:Transmembrane protein 104 n=1 Tax=Acanthosepion pharaonis TaxID=158019 RepID=A0A812BJJ1_ACAPH|nr:Transmembrane protein 104 [Sepia pharaonis]
MPGELTETGSQYSSWVGLIYIFNLIVGTGALAMPKTFYSAGWLMSTVFLIVLAFFSYLTVTFVTEAMGVANFKVKMTRKHSTHKKDLITYEPSEDSPLIEEDTSINRETENAYMFAVTERTEMGQMASMFFNKVGVSAFYFCIIIYLYGDLAIYGVTVPKSIRDIACTYQLNNETKCNRTLKDHDPCWPSLNLNRWHSYQIFIILFALCLGPFTFFNIQKTGLLQIFTSVFRWTSFIIMIVLALLRLSKGEGKGKPATADFTEIPSLFGVSSIRLCVTILYLVSDTNQNKSHIFRLFTGDYILALIFYALLSFTGIFAFQHIEDVYTLNFLPNPCEDSKTAITNIKFIEYFLVLFPVFTLSSNFPIIAVTLRNNLKTLFFNKNRPFSWFVDRIVFPLLALLPPLSIALVTDRVDFLVDGPFIISFSKTNKVILFRSVFSSLFQFVIT